MIKFKFNFKLDLEGDEELGFTLFKNEKEDIYINPENNLIFTTKSNKPVSIEMFLSPKQIKRSDLFIMYKPGMEIIIRLTENEWAKGLIKSIQERTNLAPVTILLTDAFGMTYIDGLGFQCRLLGEVAFYLDDTILEISSDLINIEDYV